MSESKFDQRLIAISPAKGAPYGEETAARLIYARLETARVATAEILGSNYSDVVLTAVFTEICRAVEHMQHGPVSPAE